MSVNCILMFAILQALRPATWNYGTSLHIEYCSFLVLHGGSYTASSSSSLFRQSGWGFTAVPLAVGEAMFTKMPKTLKTIKNKQQTFFWKVSICLVHSSSRQQFYRYSCWALLSLLRRYTPKPLLILILTNSIWSYWICSCVLVVTLLQLLL